MVHATGLAGHHHLHAVIVLGPLLVPDFLRAVAGYLFVPELLAVSVVVPVPGHLSVFVVGRLLVAGYQLVLEHLAVSVLVPDPLAVSVVGSLAVPGPLSVFVVGRPLVLGRLQVVLLVVPLQLAAMLLLLQMAEALPPRLS